MQYEEVMTEPPRRVDKPPQAIPAEISDEVKSEGLPKKEGEVGLKDSDRYSPKVLNRVLQTLKSMIGLRPDRASQLAARRDQQEELSPFEKSFLAHFEGGEPLGEKLSPGEAKFLEKSEKAWAEFFQRFLPFTAEKKAKVSDLEALIYRGLLKQAGLRAEKGTLISDLKFLSGRTDKFARLEIQGSKVLEQLAEKVPGDLLAQAIVASFLEGPEFAYQSLSHRIVNPEALKEFRSALAEAYQSPERMKEAAIREGTKETRQGIALSARTEQLISERLGLPGILPAKRKKGMFGGMEEGADAGPVFVPWYQLIFRPRKISGRPRWWVPLIYFVALSTAGLALFYLFKFLLPR